MNLCSWLNSSPDQVRNFQKLFLVFNVWPLSPRLIPVHLIDWKHFAISSEGIVFQAMNFTSLVRSVMKQAYSIRLASTIVFDALLLAWHLENRVDFSSIIEQADSSRGHDRLPNFPKHIFPLSKSGQASLLWLSSVHQHHFLTISIIDTHLLHHK